MPKVHSCRDFVRDVAPWIVVESMVDQFTLEAAPRLLAGAPDWVLDCIDNIDTKVELLKYCKDNAIPVRGLSSPAGRDADVLQIMSALGAASKADPSRIQLADISETMDDPLARSVRRRLCARLPWVLDGADSAAADDSMASPTAYPSCTRPKSCVTSFAPRSAAELGHSQVKMSGSCRSPKKSSKRARSRSWRRCRTSASGSCPCSDRSRPCSARRSPPTS